MKNKKYIQNARCYEHLGVEVPARAVIIGKLIVLVDHGPNLPLRSVEFSM